MWVQLLAGKNIEKMGTQKLYRAGDWVDVGKHLAIKWISDGSAHIPNQEINSDQIDYTAGICVTGNEISDNLKRKIETVANHLLFVHMDEPEIVFSETLIYDTKFTKIRPEFIGIGFYWLKTFEVAMPLWSYSELAIHLGTERDREITKEVIRDLRVPVYDNMLIYIRRSQKTIAFIETYNQYCEQIKEKKLALLCAFYIHKPITLALPTTWLNKDR